METIVEIVGLAVKTYIVPTNGILTRVLTESKTNILTYVSKVVEDKTVESKIVELETVLIAEEHKIVEHVVLTKNFDSRIEEEVGCNLVDEVVDTYTNELSCEGAKSDWTFDISILVTIKFVEAISELDVASNFLGE